MADLPDYYTQTSIAEAEAAGLKGGLDANKSATPVSRDIYLATDTHILYVCFTDGAWTGFDAAILTQGTLTLYANLAGGGYQIKSIADPTAAQDAATRAYTLARVAAHAALTTGIHGVGASTIASVANITTHAGLTTGIHGVGASTVASVGNITTHAGLTATHGVAVAIVGTTDAQVLTNKTLTAPIINGAVTTTGLTLPGFFLAGTLTAGNNLFIGVQRVEMTSQGGVYTTAAAGVLYLRGGQWAANYGGGIELYGPTAGAAGAFKVVTSVAGGATSTERLGISGNLATAVATWTNLTHTGLVLSSALNANSQAINSVVAPTLAGDPLIKGTRVTVAELPAMTAGKIWHGTGASPEEVDLVHGAARHTDVTRELSLSAGEAAVQAGTSSFDAGYCVIEGAANLDEPIVWFSMKVPDDFVAFVSLKATWNCEGTGNLVWKMAANYGASGEAEDTHSDAPVIGVTAIAATNTLYDQEPQAPLTLANLAAGDHIGIYLKREGTHANDTIDAIVHLLGLLFTYTANQ